MSAIVITAKPEAGLGDVVGPAGATDGHLAVFDGATGKLIKDGGAVPTASGDVVGPASSTDNALARYDLATGKLLQDGTVTESDTGGLANITTLSMSGQFTSTLATGTAPFVVASTTNVANLNASSLNGANFAAPGAIGGGTAASGTFTTITAGGAVSGVTTLDMSGALTGLTNITGGASSMVLTAGTGNSRTLTLRTTTSGGTATAAITIGATQLCTFADGAVATPSLNFTTSTTSGIWWNNGSSRVSISIAGVQGLGIGQTGATFAGSLNTTGDLTVPSANALIFGSLGSYSILADGVHRFRSNGGTNGACWSVTTNNKFIARNAANSADCPLQCNDLLMSKTITAAGTTGAQTIDKAMGDVNFAAGATSLVVTNSLATVNSIIQCNMGGNDATAIYKCTTKAAGSFTIRLSAGGTGEVPVSFVLFN